MSRQSLVSIEPRAEAGAVIAGGAPLAGKTTGTPQKTDSDPAVGQLALEVRGLSKDFRSGFLRRRLRGIADVSFSVPEGSVFAILGHNGAGKTTTINCILDLAHADGGQVRIFGQDHNRPQARASIGYLPERPYFFEHLTGRELLRFYADLLDIPADLRADRIEWVLERTGMTEAAGRRLRKYSKGMLQRIGLAQALLGDPRLLILDEPMSGLDPMGRREVRELLLELKAQGKTIILSSHIVPDVEAVADAVGILRQGSMVYTSPLDTAGSGCSYEVFLRDGESQLVTASNVSSLREVLQRCHDDGIGVARVEPRRSGLEEIFLAAHRNREEGS